MRFFSACFMFARPAATTKSAPSVIRSPLRPSMMSR
jgi:hypothetical protein